MRITLGQVALTHRTPRASRSSSTDFNSPWDRITTAAAVELAEKAGEESGVSGVMGAPDLTTSAVDGTDDGGVGDAAQRNSTQGQTVVIDHGNGYETSYSHLSKINVRKGQTVRRGDIIALSGDTGLSLAPTSTTKCGSTACASTRSTISSWS